MLIGVIGGIFCCLLGVLFNVVGLLESVEFSDGYIFVEVKFGRVLRVKYVGFVLVFNLLLFLLDVV